jgi:hypothetical protein
MYQIRKCQTWTVTSKTQTATLDPEKFRNLSTPYEGDSEEDFVNYVSGLYLDDIYEELDEETISELDKFFDNVEWEDLLRCFSSAWYNSAWDGEESWFDIGEENPEFRRTGGFEVRYSTEKNY